jgi:hypothetical protein
MFGKRKAAYVDEGAYADRTEAVAEKAWYGPTRAIMTLIGAAAALVLIWLAAKVGEGSNSEYWATFGLVAAAGLAMAFSQILGGWTKFGLPRISGNVLLLGFVPALVVGGWILMAHQPDSGFLRNDLRGWSDDLGLLGLVTDFGDLLPAIAFLLGLTFGFAFDTTGPRTRAVVDRKREVVEEDVRRPAAVPAATARSDADEPVTAERHQVVTTHETDREPAHAGYRGTPVAPQPEPPPRRSDDLD